MKEKLERLEQMFQEQIEYAFDSIYEYVEAHNNSVDFDTVSSVDDDIDEREFKYYLYTITRMEHFEITGVYILNDSTICVSKKDGGCYLGATEMTKKARDLGMLKTIMRAIDFMENNNY